MSIRGILERPNENAFGNFPFSSPVTFKDVIVDALFIQFDGFAPVLNTLQIQETKIRLSITLDTGTHTFDFLKTTYDSGVEALRMYIENRYVGTIQFGPGLANLFATAENTILDFNATFLKSIVRPIPSTVGVFTLEGCYGNVILSKEEEIAADASMFYNAPTGGITFNAVTNHFVPSSTLPILKKINLETPVNNNIFISGNDVVKFEPTDDGDLEISIVTTNLTGTTFVPTLAV